MCSIKKDVPNVHKLLKIDLCMFCFPISDHVMLTLRKVAFECCHIHVHMYACEKKEGKFS